MSDVQNSYIYLNPGNYSIQASEKDDDKGEAIKSMDAKDGAAIAQVKIKDQE